MSQWTRIAFAPNTETIPAEVQKSVEASLDDPDTEIREGRVISKHPWSFDISRIRHLQIPATYILVTKCEDTVGTGTWYLFEPSDGEFVLCDAKTGGEHRYGKDAFDYLELEHEIEGVWT